MNEINSLSKWKIIKECISKSETIGCYALLEVEGTDIYISYINNNEYLYTFRCPCCNKENIIPEKDIPINIKKIILNNERKNILKYLGKVC